jgi:hypothetical protein
MPDDHAEPPEPEPPPFSSSVLHGTRLDRDTLRALVAQLESGEATPGVIGQSHGSPNSYPSESRRA